MKREAQTIAVQLLRDHPGWSDTRVARELERRRVGASADAVQAWRVDSGLAPYTKRVAEYPPPRVAGVWLSCGHLVHPEAVENGRGRCGWCPGDFPIGRS